MVRGMPQLEAICAEHPDEAVELRRILANLSRVGLVSGPCQSNEPPRELGDFRLIERLGQGGMGVVYDY